MKLNLFTILLISIAAFINAHAQTGKGSFMIGGSVNLQHSVIDKPETYLPFSPEDDASPVNSLTLRPTIGYFFVKNFMTGAQISYNHTWSPDHDYKANSYGAGPVIRYYIPFGKFAVFPEAAAMFSKDHAMSYFEVPDYGGPTRYKLVSDTKMYSYRAGVGITWFVSPNVGIEAIIAYNRTKSSLNIEENTTKTSDLYFNLGLQFYLPKKN